MTPIRTENHPTAIVSRARLIASAVVSAYLNEISGVWRSEEGAPDAGLAAAQAM